MSTIYFVSQPITRSYESILEFVTSIETSWKRINSSSIIKEGSDVKSEKSTIGRKIGGKPRKCATGHIQSADVLLLKCDLP